MQFKKEHLSSEKWSLGPERFHLKIRTLGRLEVPVFSASMIRGAIGHALLLRYCDCEVPSDHESGCVYAELFETGAGNAFVITPPESGRYRAGECFTCQVSLLLTDTRLQAAFFDALESGLSTGLGPSKVPCELTEIKPSPCQLVQLDRHAFLHMNTPWFTKHRNQSLKANNFTIHTLLIAAAQRQRQLVELGLLWAQIPKNLELLHLADQVQVSSELFDVRSERRSCRQNRKHPVQGVKGMFQIVHPKPNGLAPISEMLSRTQWVHGGAKVSFGLGGLSVETVQPTLTPMNSEKALQGESS